MNEHSLLKESKSCLCLSFQVFIFTLCLQPHCIVLLFQVGRVFSGWVCFLRFCSLCLFCDIQAEHLPPWSWNHVKQKSKYYKGWKTALDLFAVNFNPEQRPTEVGRLEPKWMMSEFTLPLFHSWHRTNFLWQNFKLVCCHWFPCSVESENTQHRGKVEFEQLILIAWIIICN